MSSQRRILHIIDTLQPHGAQRLLQGILRTDSAHEHVAVALSAKPGDLDLGDKLLETASSGKYNLLASLLHVRNIIRTHDISVLHCHLFKSQVVGWLLKKIWFRNITLIFHEHGRICAVEKSAFEWKLYRYFMKASRRAVNAYVAISEYVQKSLVEEAAIDPATIVIVRNAIREEFYTAIPAKISQRSTVGFAARLIERKGWKTVLEAATLLKNKGWNGAVVIAGHGPDAEAIEAYIEQHQLKNTVHVVGSVSDMAQWYNSLSLFVTTPTWEPLGLTHIEAMARGIPVIATDVPALNELITHGENGLLIPAADAQQLASTIMQLEQDQQLYTQLQTNGQATAQEYRYAAYMESLNQLYTTPLS